MRCSCSAEMTRVFLLRTRNSTRMSPARTVVVPSTDAVCMRVGIRLSWAAPTAIFSRSPHPLTGFPSNCKCAERTNAGPAPWLLTRISTASAELVLSMLKYGLASSAHTATIAFDFTTMRRLVLR